MSTFDEISNKVMENINKTMKFCQEVYHWKKMSPALISNNMVIYQHG